MKGQIRYHTSELLRLFFEFNNVHFFLMSIAETLIVATVTITLMKVVEYEV